MISTVAPPAHVPPIDTPNTVHAAAAILWVVAVAAGIFRRSCSSAVAGCCTCWPCSGRWC
ncbi:hypothetical protein [Nonomuraea sp. LPB2021202275-12-8]|uniref:hypothetical protein n=1 Tax=Nonomuraea sp. LPB2021202275-12-8 TaxID=3120159 RepID=UPI00300D87E3